MNLTLAKTKRVAARCPGVALNEFLAPVTDRPAFLALIQTFVAAIIIIATGSVSEMVDKFSSAALALHSLGWALLIWAVISAFRAPFIVRAKEKLKGTWHGSRYVYHSPELVATLRCKATGNPQLHKVVFSDAEPNSFVYYFIELESDPPKNLYSATIACGMILTSDLKPGGGASKGGTRIGADREASLLITMKPEMISQTVRIFMRDFSIGDPEDKDGDEGQPLRF